MTDKEMQDKFIVSRQEEINKLTIDYVKAYLDMEKEIKAIKQDLKLITDEAKENQVNTKLAKKAIARLKYQMKNSEDIIIEEDSILESLRGDSGVITNVTELLQKN